MGLLVQIFIANLVKILQKVDTYAFTEFASGWFVLAYSGVSAQANPNVCMVLYVSKLHASNTFVEIFANWFACENFHCKLSSNFAKGLNASVYQVFERLACLVFPLVFTRANPKVCIVLNLTKLQVNITFDLNFAKMFAFVNFHCKLSQNFAKGLHMSVTVVLSYVKTSPRTNLY